VYEGEYENGQRHGRGKMTANGDVYIGTWNHDNRHGEGAMTYANGDVYEGEWLNNAKNGQGIMRYADGTVYPGYWNDDKITGVSERTRASGVPPDQYSIGAPRVSTDIFSMTTTRRPEVTIKLSDGREYNIASARGLHQLIESSGKLQNAYRVSLTPHDKAMLDQFVSYSMGGKKRKNGHKRLRRTLNDGSHHARPPY